jgi:transcriptional regulator with XRE-family HTH domain
MPSFEPLGDIIRRRRMERNLSQEALAKLADVSRRHLALLESNTANVSVLILMKIARALELSELAIGDLCLRAAPPEIPSLLAAAAEVESATKAVAEARAQLAAFEVRLEKSAKLIHAVIRRALRSAGSQREVIDAALSMEKEDSAAIGETLADLIVPTPPSAVPERYEPAAAKAAARKRAR